MTSDPLTKLRAEINAAYLVDEQIAIDNLLNTFEDYDPVSIGNTARDLVASIRAGKDRQTLVEAFLHEYQLNTEEGVVLMRIAEALLRIPDTQTQDRFLQEKLTEANWQEHLQHSDSILVNLSTSALMMTGKIESHSKASKQVFEQLLGRVGTPLIRSALKNAMQQLAYQFVIAETIANAITQARYHPAYRYSFDMLGEAALTAGDAERYYQAYLNAVDELARHSKSSDIHANPGISIKLSALCPRYEPLQHRRAVKELTAKLLYLVKQARVAGISVTVDAEESERLDMSLTIFAGVFCSPDLQGWSGFGLAVQAYQKRAFSVIHWLAALAERHQQQIPLRLVKGAYWDTEIKRAQENGLENYPVFIRKTTTDLSYLACAKFMLSKEQAFYPQFGTHNAHTVAAIHEFGKNHPGYEFQCLHGMGEQLYEEIVRRDDWNTPCRIYAPVGCYQDLLPYLVRRLLENGANTSFINQVENPDINVDQIIGDPILNLKSADKVDNPPLVLPGDLYGNQRNNAEGININDAIVLENLQQDLDSLANENWRACPLVNGKLHSGEPFSIYDPSDSRLPVGQVIHADKTAIRTAIDGASDAFAKWRLCPVKTRAFYLNKAADLLESSRLELISLCIREGGRTVKDALSEVREAVDFCRYYGAKAMDLFDRPEQLPGPTGESNHLHYYGRGVFVCISPWNFPIAIFIGQISAALAAGNTVIAKPAGHTSLTAMRCIELLHQAGIPDDVLQFLPGEGSIAGKQLLSDPRIAGVAFTGSTATGRLINQQLARDNPAIVPLIAETGGQNAMVTDSSAHTEQLVQDAVFSAFNSAGQRCSALRVLYIQEEAANTIIEMLVGAMHQLIIGNPGRYRTDIGPVINQRARKQLVEHVKNMQRQATILYQMVLEKELTHGSFFPPTLIELKSLSQLKQENFGPILHIIRYKSSQLDQVVHDINATRYGLTLGIQSRIQQTINHIQQNIKVGNIYVNRNMIGAVVGAQPFGGMGLSGTGPKAGGPNYLLRFAVEQTVSTNTAAIGGNVRLMTRDSH